MSIEWEGHDLDVLSEAAQQHRREIGHETCPSGGVCGLSEDVCKCTEQREKSIPWGTYLMMGLCVGTLTFCVLLIVVAVADAFSPLWR